MDRCVCGEPIVEDTQRVSYRVIRFRCGSCGRSSELVLAHTGGWIGVDLDGTLAHYDDWHRCDHIGEPVPLMKDRVDRWHRDGKDVRIVTARVAGEPEGVRDTIADWQVKHFGFIFPVTCQKDYGMLELYDDRAIQIERNTGRRVDGVDA